MDELLLMVLEAAKPYLMELVSAGLAALILWLRARAQVVVMRGQVASLERAEMPVAAKKAAAMAEATRRLPLGIRPLTTTGMGTLVERALQDVRKQAPK